MSAPLTTVRVNGRARTLAQPSLPAILTELGLQPDAPGIAVAINGTVIRRAEWAQVNVHDGDEVEVLTAVQGG